MAEIALAVVPIFFGALKGFSKIREMAHLLRHYPKEITDLRNKVDIQCRCFKTEVYHLIIDTLDDHVAQSIIWNEHHEYWRNEALGVALEQHLGGLYHHYTETMENVNAELEEIAAS
ncbi:hypothetical protein MYCTH_2297292 [Thermothelomyces thermophilus ATCC 42464]|uniref:Uncharacterized protein n=1 Tax=Thermothelomyces thermophilus (strain ATCC 42464 / BCRC 31852 / DSM 1799) TaxID=573729 RepID=G2Q545_THET4|nr:uncharacterized protein MYCTH_2297292 [Thermothelomyces thermophilus ATCC 42464]AEO54583.1 hypothetical protein MYCTH_2297292 [Thermothelomyces thermophilus ATCC 42464]